MRALPTLLLPLSLLLAVLASVAPVAAAELGCVLVPDVGGVCLSTDPDCPAAWYKPPFEDFTAGAEECHGVTPASTGHDACSHLRVGTYAKPTVREYDGSLCVSVDREGGVTCVVAAYEGNLASVHGRPVCALP